MKLAHPIVVAAILTALCACGDSGGDEVDAETAAIVKRVPVGTPYDDLAGAMQALGFSCTTGQRQFTDAKGRVRDAERHLSCDQEERYWLVCSRRTRAILVQLNGRLSHIFVNVGRFCA